MQGSSPLWALLVLALPFGVWAVWQDARDEDKLAAFYARCDAQGGQVLNSTKRDGGGWIGCYKGVIELPNEG